MDNFKDQPIPVIGIDGITVDNSLEGFAIDIVTPHGKINLQFDSDSARWLTVALVQSANAWAAAVALRTGTTPPAPTQSVLLPEPTLDVATVAVGGKRITIQQGLLSFSLMLSPHQAASLSARLAAEG